MDEKRLESILDSIAKDERKRVKESIKKRLDSLHNPEKNIARKPPLPSECKTSLEWFRKSRDLTQNKLSELSGVNVRMIQHYEQGVKDINKAQGITLLKLANALECNIEDILETT